MGVGNYCHVASAPRRARRPRGRRGAGHIVSPRAQLMIFLVFLRGEMYSNKLFDVADRDVEIS